MDGNITDDDDLVRFGYGQLESIARDQIVINKKIVSLIQVFMDFCAQKGIRKKRPANQFKLEPFTTSAPASNLTKQASRLVKKMRRTATSADWLDSSRLLLKWNVSVEVPDYDVLVYYAQDVQCGIVAKRDAIKPTDAFKQLVDTSKPGIDAHAFYEFVHRYLNICPEHANIVATRLKVYGADFSIPLVPPKRTHDAPLIQVLNALFIVDYSQIFIFQQPGLARNCLEACFE